MTRLARHHAMMELATVIAQRSTCRRRRVGCVLTDAWGRVLSMGHNGVPRGMEHCIDTPCPGVGHPPGEGLEYCTSVHGEQNSLLFCPDVMKIDTCWVTTSPCIHCTKMLLNTSCQTIVYLEEYPQPLAKHLWLFGKDHWTHGRRWLQLEEYE